MPLKHNDYSLNKVIKLVQNATTELSDDKLFCNPYKSVVGFEQIGRIDAAINLNGVNITDKTWEKTEFFKIYPVTIIISVPLVVFVEKIRIKKFSILPVLFFKPGESVSEKFHEAALLCLSTGLVIADIVILNNEYFKLITIEKLTLNTFFLGFSFPLSLITLSVVFSMMENTDIPSISILMNICFWTITLLTIFQ